MNREEMAETLNKKYQYKLEDLQMILESIPANVFFKDLQGRYQIASHVCEMLSGGDENFTIIGKTDYEIQPDKVLGKRFLEEDLSVVANEKGMKYLQEMEFDGVKYYYEISKSPIYNLEGELIGLIGMVNDMTEVIRLQKQLEEYSYMDMMTGVYNRRYYEQRTGEVKAEQLPLAVIMADCNGLKFINDTYGHKQGDYLITSTVTNLKRHLPENGEIIRMGGDEFLIICPNCSAQQCEAFLESVREGEANITVEDIRLTTSYGYAMIEADTDTMGQAVEEADMKMYLQKRKREKIITE